MLIFGNWLNCFREGLKSQKKYVAIFTRSLAVARVGRPYRLGQRPTFSPKNDITQ